MKAALGPIPKILHSTQIEERVHLYEGYERAGTVRRFRQPLCGECCCAASVTKGQILWKLPLHQGHGTGSYNFLCLLVWEQNRTDTTCMQGNSPISQNKLQKLLFQQIGGSVCGCPWQKSPTTWGSILGRPQIRKPTDLYNISEADPMVP